MIFLNIENVKPGMLLGKSISFNNQILLTEETQLTDSYISRLKELGVSGVYISNRIGRELEIHDVITKETRMKTFRLVEHTLTKVKQPKDISSSLSKAIREVIYTIITELLASKTLTINLYTIRTFSNYIFHHSINVSLFSLIIGIAKGYDEKRLLQLGVGALLHDLGKLQISPKILDKPDRLTREEFEEIKRHPQLGYTILRESGEFDYTATSILYQHHEKLDGSGYPNQLKGDAIYDYAKIVAIADIFDAITSSRVYNKAMPNHEAIEILLAYASCELDKNLVGLFLEHIPAFPLGTFVHLNNASKGVVIAQNKGLPLRPLLLIVEEGGREVRPYECNLAKELDLVIVKTG